MPDETPKNHERQHQLLIGEKEYVAAIDSVIAYADHTIHIFDSDLSVGGYSGVKRYEVLRNFLLRGRSNRLVIVVHEIEYLTTHCPRLIELLKTCSHAISIHKTTEHARVPATLSSSPMIGTTHTAFTVMTCGFC